jgi:phage tail tape-measure protein
MILEMVDRLSAPARRARGGVRGLADQARAMGQRIRQAAGQVRNGERSLEHFARRARRLRQVALGRIFQAMGGSVRGLTRNLGSLIARLRLVERAGRAAGAGLRKLGGAGLGMLKNGLLAGGAAVAGGGAFALFDLFRTAGQFEQYQVQLEGLEGSAQAARKAMRWVQEFTAKTPFEIDQVMEAFVALKAYGIDPMNGSLTALGDASAGMSKPLLQAIEAMADATTGEFERLKEFGIRASKEGNRVSFSFRKNGKDIRRDAEFTGAAIEEALTGIFRERFGGGMERQSRTLFGMISNLKDSWTSFQLMVADAGIFDMVKKDVEGLLARVGEMAKNGQLKKWAEEISDRLEKAWSWGRKFVEETDWNKVGEEVRRIADAVGVLADTILALRDAASWLNVGSGVDEFLDSVPGRVQRLRGSLAPQSPGPAPGSPASRLPSGNSLYRGLSGKPTASAAPQIGGALKIDISSAPGLAVRATPAPAPGKMFPLEVRTGRTMRSSS